MSSLHASALRLTPSNSPFLRSPSPRSPTKPQRTEEVGLHLKKVIGTTTATANAFAFLPAQNKFAFTAGAAAVLATVDDDLHVTQCFFRASPTPGPPARDTIAGWPSTPTSNESRYRPATVLNDTASPREWSDSPTGKSTTAKDRIKAASSVALSPDGRWLAVGETGYRPRILIFSARDGSSESPTCVLYEHTFGVHALNFSPDSKWLASLGNLNDGFLNLWKIEERTGMATLHASNKCTSTIHSLSWVGRTIVTAGLRFVKVWRPDDDASAHDSKDSFRGSAVTPRVKYDVRCADYGNSILSPRHRVLPGKNSLLGDLLDTTFISIIAISSSKAIIATESGQICVLDDAEKTQSLTAAAQVGFPITAARIDEQEMYHVVGRDGQDASFLIPDLERRCTAKLGGAPSVSPSKDCSDPRCVVAMATLRVGLVEIDADKTIQLRQSGARAPSSAATQSRQMPAHQGAVVGVVPMHSDVISGAAFFTFSSDGSVQFWNDEGSSVAEPLVIPIDSSPDAYGMTNEVKACLAICGGTLIASGDKYGHVALMDLQQRRCVYKLRAHSAEVLDLVGFERGGAHYLASASRDRTVQLYYCDHGKLHLLQTMDEHAGAVTALVYSQIALQLVSSSADRSIVIRDAVARHPDHPESLAFVMLRAITLKAAPTSICLAGQPDALLVATLDRSIGRYSTKTGQAGFTFKCSDSEGGEAVNLSKIVYCPSLNGNPTIAAISSSDKSVRLYSEYGSLIARDYGHTEGITDIALVAGGVKTGDETLTPLVVTSAADSTIFLWETMATAARSQLQASHQSNSEIPPSLGPPLRKVLSHSEISRMRRDRSTDEQEPQSPKAVSPPKVKKKSSRLSLVQTPRLEPALRSSFEPSRRRSLMQRSPSPPSPRHSTKKDHAGRGAYATLRSKSSENVIFANPVPPSTSGFGTLTGSCETVCRSLRTLRKKLSSSPAGDSITTDALFELERELKLTARAVGEKSQLVNLDEAVISKLVDQASDKIVGLLDQKIKARVEDEFRRNGDVPSPPTSSQLSLSDSSLETERHTREILERSNLAHGALETRTITE